MATDPDYRRNQKESQKTWRENNPSYWRRYRRNNPKYCRRNQLLQIKRDQIRRITRLAKMDTLKANRSIKPGAYYLIPLLAKKDSIDTVSSLLYSEKKRRWNMIQKEPLSPNRVRKITGSFAFIEHRFLHDGFFSSLDHHELLFYFFLAIVADREGLSYYSYDKICSLLRISVDEYILARNKLIEKDLIAFDGSLFQVLHLPKKPVSLCSKILKTEDDMEKHDPATIHQLISHHMGKNYD
jgi:hypothetical protein